MTWNHRVMRSEYVNEHLDFVEVFYTIREVYYGSDDETVEGWTSDPIAPQGGTVEELRAELEQMLACLDQPVLDEAEELARMDGKPA